jgi:hypothetical protein
MHLPDVKMRIGYGQRLSQPALEGGMTDSIGADEAERYQEPFAVPDAPGPSIDIMHEPHCQLQCQVLNTRPSYRQRFFLPDTSACSA